MNGEIATLELSIRTKQIHINKADLREDQPNDQGDNNQGGNNGDGRVDGPEFGATNGGESAYAGNQTTYGGGQTVYDGGKTPMGMNTPNYQYQQ